MSKKFDPLDNPARNAATLANLCHAYQRIGVNGWMEDASLADVIDAWWAAQKRKADRLEKEAQR